MNPIKGRRDAVKRPRKLPKLVKGAIKLFLNLTILGGLGALIWHGFFLFTQQTEPLKNSIILIVGIAVWFLLIKLARNRSYRWVKPSFKLTTFSTIAILLIFTFAGIQPMSTYKDNLIEKWKAQQAEETAKAKQKMLEQVSQAVASVPGIIKEAPSKSESSTIYSLEIREAELEAFKLINAVREESGVPPTKWDDELYKLSKTHTQEMANHSELFHTPMGESHGENVWGGKGYHHYSTEELAKAIVGSWLSSPLHKAWLLHEPIKESVVSIVINEDGQYASWSFWTNKLSRGPTLIEKVTQEWRNSGSDQPWIEWLISKGYLKP